MIATHAHRLLLLRVIATHAHRLLLLRVIATHAHRLLLLTHSDCYSYTVTATHTQ